MDYLLKEIREGINKIYQDPKKSRKLENQRKKLLAHLENIKKKNFKKSGFEKKSTTI